MYGTAVNASAFQHLIAALRTARLIDDAGQLKRLQQLLASLHHYAGPVDGTYGTLLRAAIQDFELTQGLPVTGLASLDLLGVLEAAAVAQDRQPRAAQPAQAVPAPVSVPQPASTAQQARGSVREPGLRR